MAEQKKGAGRVRGIFTSRLPDNREDEQVNLNNLGDLLISSGAPGISGLVALGDTWQVKSVGTAALTALPTTASALALWNGEPQGGLGAKIYVIDSLVVFKSIIDTTQLDNFTVWTQLMLQPVAAPTDGGQVKASLSGRTYDGRARTIANITPITGRWNAIGGSPPLATAINGSAWQCVEFPLLGRFVVPPGGAFCVHAAEITATAAKFVFVIRWHEIRNPYV